MMQVADSHDVFTQRVIQRLGFHRKKLLIPPRWNIDVVVLCPDEMESHYGAEGIRASIAWEPLEYANFRMRICCDTPDHTLDWLILHELLEAMAAPYAVFTNQLLHRQRSGSKADLDQRHRDIRDEMIEWLLAIIAPDKRPPVGSNI